MTHLYLECRDDDLSEFRSLSGPLRYSHLDSLAGFENLRSLTEREQRAYRMPWPTVAVAEFAPMPTLLPYLTPLHERRVMLLFRQRAWSEAQLSAAHLVSGTLRRDPHGWQLEHQGRLSFYAHLRDVLRPAHP